MILGARTVAQLDDNLGAADLHLSPEETALLSEASAPQVSDYPYGQPGIDQRSRLRYGSICQIHVDGDRLRHGAFSISQTV